MEESENQLVNNLDDSEESGDNMIIVSSSEDNKQDDEEGEEIVLDDEDADLAESLSEDGEDVNDAKENDDSVAAESNISETVEKNPPKPAKKATKKKDKGI